MFKKFVLLFYCLAFAPIISCQQTYSTNLAPNEFQVGSPDAQTAAQPINAFLGLLSQHTQAFINELSRSGVDRNILVNIINIRQSILDALPTATRSPQGLMDLLAKWVETGMKPLAQQLAEIDKYSAQLTPEAMQIKNEFQNYLNAALHAASQLANSISTNYNVANSVSNLVSGVFKLFGNLLGGGVKVVGEVFDTAGDILNEAGNVIGGGAQAVGNAIGGAAEAVGNTFSKVLGGFGLGR